MSGSVADTAAPAAAVTAPPADLVQALRSQRAVLITSHANPDGDAIGSQAGLARVLRELGIEVALWNLDPSPPLYSHLLEGLEVHVGATPPPGLLERFPAIFYVECPTPERTGLDSPTEDRIVFNVDHHLGNSDYGHHNWVRPDRASVSIMIFEIAVALGVRPDQVACDALLLGLVTDTGGFRFSNTTAEAHRSAAALVQAGASPERVSRALYESRSEASVRLLAEVLRTLERSADGAVATAILTNDMLERTGATRQDGEHLIDYPRSIRGVEIAALLRELEPGRYKISLRSRGEVSVESVARRHGGGGHRNAAGCELAGALDEVRRQLVDELSGLLRTEGAGR